MSTIKSSDEHLTLNADGTSKDIKLQSNASEKVIIKSDGNVGLGTSNPDSSLEIYKASTAELMIGSDNGGTAQISLYENNSTTKEATIKYDGFANNLVIGTSGQANAIVIPRDSGYVTMPNQPAFLATANGSLQSNVGLAETVNFGTEVFDQNNDYNASTSTFTAPVTGRYYFSGSVRTGEIDRDASYYRIELITANRTYKFALIDTGKLYSADPLYHPLSFSGLADMDAGDSAYISFVRQGGASTADISGAAEYTFFSGHLVC